jgi:hypothetical protein
MVEKYGATDYSDKELEACRRILMEIVNLLKDFSDHIALVGGWVPYYIIPQSGNPHVGSLDVDIAFDFRNITNESYETILAILQNNGYYQSDEHKPFQWWKKVQIGAGEAVTVELDLLAPEYGGRGKKHENQLVQNARARKARGSDLLFDDRNRLTEVILEGALPNGSLDTVRCKVAGVVPFLVMKGMAIGRGKTKDAYDIEYVIHNYAGGVEALIAEFQNDLTNMLVQEGLGKIRTKFETVDHIGPNDVVTFLEIDDPENRAIRKRIAYETVSALLDALDIRKFV